MKINQILKSKILIMAAIAVTLLFINCSKKTETETNHDAKPQETKGINDLKKETGYATVNGVKMYYEICGEGEPLVLLHGSYMTIPLNWNKLIPEFAKNRKVIAVELQGHGRTVDIDRPITYENMADDVAALLDYLKIEKADVLGYSMGGGVALQTAIRHPEKINKVVNISGSAKYDGWVKEVLDIFPVISAEMFKDTPIKKQYDSLSPTPEHFHEFVKKVIASDLKPYNWTEQLKNTKAPVFTIIGDADGVVLEHATEMYRLKGGGKMGDMSGLEESRLAILPGSTHQSIIERTKWITEMVNEFLDFKPEISPDVQH